ncbi:hypothetical protein ACFHW0_25935 [Micromonospora sp. LOL_025]|uniref:hypothetical protein n=1 Tax=Micromonospora sp. LOL_025 TaxID=3345413 RepID=UPI003A871B72
MNGGLLAMETGSVDAASRRLGQTGEQLAADWNAAKAAIAGADASIGTGRLAAAFRRTYDPAGRQVQANADTFPPRLADLARAGSISAGAYTDANGTAAAVIDQVGG